MGQETIDRGIPDRLSRRRFVRTTTAGAIGSGVAVTGCLGRAREPGTIVMSGDTDFADIMHGDGDGDGDGDEPSVQQALWDAGLDEDIRVDVQASVDDSAARMQQYQSALQAGRSPPDIHMMDSGWTIPFILREQTTPLPGALPDDVIDHVESEYLDAALETARHPETGDLHAIPLFPDFGTMLYRRDLIEDAGYDTGGWNDDPPSWEAFSVAIADARAGADLDFGFTTQAAAYEGLSCCSFNEIMSSWGGAYFGGTANLFEAGDRPITVADESVLDAIRMLRSFIHGDDAAATLDGYHQISPSAIVQWSEEESLGPFSNGNAVAHRNWPFSIAETGGDDAFGENLGVMPMPYAVSENEAEHEGVGGTASALGGWHLTLNPNTDHADEALQVLEAFTHENVMLTIFELQGFLPPILELVEDVDEDDVGPTARYTEQLQIAGNNAVPRPVTDVWPEQSALIYQEVHAALRGVKTPEAAMVDLEERLERSEMDVGEQRTEAN